VAKIRKKSNRGDTSTRNRTDKASQSATQVMLTRGTTSSGPSKPSASSPAQNDNKKNKSKMKVSQGKTSKKNMMVTVMLAYAIVMGVLGLWAFNNFFLFYFTEGSPVMGVHTKTSRVANTPDIPDKDMQAATNAVSQIGDGLEKVTIHKVGPTIHFFLVVKQDLDLQQGRALGHKAIVAFADALAQPEMFGTYEAQIIVTKKDLPKLDEKVIMRQAGDEGAEQPFPQYGVSNRHTDGVNKGISWSHNGA